ncbi:MAG: hypothetical protein FWH18_07865 [Marinilabiliaceae bacterium]|nr:hypothetical protein [Marinilabiliaceae bacterium]
MRKFLTIVLWVCASILNAQENTIHNDNSKLPKYELSFSVGHYVTFGKLVEGFGTYSISYHKRNNHKNWFWYGFYSYLFPGWVVNSPPCRDYFRFYSIASSIRLSYLNKPKTIMYSGLSLGIGLMNGDVGGIYPFFQVTSFGFSYGKNFFVGGELGYGLKGIGCFNAGYRF